MAQKGTAVTGVERIGRAFRTHNKRAALMPYLMGGYPDLSASLTMGEACVAAGADLIELGVPFSDPLADGPVIQAAGEQALKAGATFEAVLREVAMPLAPQVPIVLMCYANPVLTRGVGPVAAQLADAGVAGLIVPDLPAEEAGDLRAACVQEGIALVPLVAPTTPPERVDSIAAGASGFIYVVAVTGVTGERGELPPELEDVVARVRGTSTMPVAVGFGIGTPDQVGQVAAIADGVIVGSRLVRAVAEAPTVEEGITGVDAFLRSASHALV